MPECELCGKEFDTERGVKVHAAQVHKDSEKKREELLIMELLEEGKKSVGELADTLDMQKDKVRDRLDDLMEKEYISRNVESSKEAVYTLTERGQKEIPELVKELLDETKDFVDSVRGSFEKHIGPLLPKVDIKWPKRKKKGD